MNPPVSSLRLYVFDDLPPNGFAQLRSLLRQNQNVSFILPDEALARLAADPIEPFPLAFGLGAAGERLAHRLHQKNKLSDQIVRLDISRIELRENAYEFAGDFANELRRHGLAADDPVALVDDTVYTGGTVERIRRAWPRQWQPQISLFCLQGIASSLDRLAEKITVRCAYPIAGVPEKEVSIIRLSGLFQPGSIRLKNGRELAFYQRPRWMRAWFPTNYASVTRYCAQLSLDRQTNQNHFWAGESLAII
jgi:hypothetical protein